MVPLQGILFVYYKKLKKQTNKKPNNTWYLHGSILVYLFLLTLSGKTAALQFSFFPTFLIACGKKKKQFFIKDRYQQIFDTIISFNKYLLLHQSSDGIKRVLIFFVTSPEKIVTKMVHFHCTKIIL